MGSCNGDRERDVYIEHFTEQGIKDPEINRMTDKVTLTAERALENEDIMLSPVVVEIHTEKRGVFSQRIDFPKGNPKNPVSMEETKQNIRRCASYAARHLAIDKIDQAIEMTNVYSNILSGMMDAFASIISNNLNIVMKVLTSIAIIITLPILMSSLYGMNVKLPLGLDKVNLNS
jgi:magnesium transporter